MGRKNFSALSLMFFREFGYRGSRKMYVMLLVMFAVTYTIFLPIAVNAAENTGAFLARCADNFKDCKSEVVKADTAILAEILFGKSEAEKKACPIPKGVSNEGATKAVVAWLNQHPETHVFSTFDGIQAAIKGVWHCQTEVAEDPAEKSRRVPRNTGEFVSYCGSHYVPCANKIVVTDVSHAVSNEHCASPKGIKSEYLAKAVLSWLGQHPETFKLATNDGISEAIDHLWPCR